MTFAIGMAPIALVIMFVLFWWIERYWIIKAFLISVSASIFAVIVFSLFVAGLLIKIFGVTATSDQTVLSSLYACLSLAAIYTVLQGFFFWIISRYVSICIRGALLVSAMSNLLAALIMYVRI